MFEIVHMRLSSLQHGGSPRCAAPLPALSGTQQQHAQPNRGARQPRLERVRLPWMQRTRVVARRVAPRAASFPPSPSGEQYEANNRSYADLTAKIEAAAAEAVDALSGSSVYLVGMMGSGKSTVGRMLAQALSYCFFDSDQLIERLAGRTVSQIFEEDGEEEFREVETQVLHELAPFRDCIVSTGGGAATRGVNWGHMQGGIVVWLNGPPSLLARRVLRDGTAARPLLAQPESSSLLSSSDAGGGSGTAVSATGDDEGGEGEYERTLARLTELLEQRRQQYGAADIVVSLEGEDPATADLGAPAAVVAYRVLAAINERVKRDAATRADRQDFEVVNTNLPPTMRVVKSINADPFLP